MGMDPDSKLFEVNMSETSTAEEEQLKDTLDTGADIIDKYLDMFNRMQEANPKIEFDQVEFFNYMNQKILKLNDLDINDYITIKEDQIVDDVGEFEEGAGGAGGGMGAGDQFAGEIGDEIPDEDLEGEAEQGEEIPGEGPEDADALPHNMRPPKKLPVERRVRSAKAVISEYIKKQEVKIKEKRRPIMNLDLTAALPSKKEIKGMMNESNWQKKFGNCTMKLDETKEKPKKQE